MAKPRKSGDTSFEAAERMLLALAEQTYYPKKFATRIANLIANLEIYRKEK